MAKRELSREQLTALEELAQRWGKIVANRAYGEAGSDLDVDSDQMEPISAAVSRGLARGTLEQLTQRQAQQLLDTLPCPACQKSCARKTRPRHVVARSHRYGPRAHRPQPRLSPGFFPPNDPISNLMPTGTARRCWPRSSTPAPCFRRSSWPPERSASWPTFRSVAGTSGDSPKRSVPSW